MARPKKIVSKIEVKGQYHPVSVEIPQRGKITLRIGLKGGGRHSYKVVLAPPEARKLALRLLIADEKYGSRI